jgi:Uma2 family endonuclease
LTDRPKEENMDTLVLDPNLSDRLVRERRERGLDRFDEVWEGVYVMASAPNDEHQKIVTRFARPLIETIEDASLGEVRFGVNLASDPDDWECDFRIPDIVVFLKGSKSVCHNTFWSGPPDFVVEVISPFDKSRDKLEFYSKIRTRELLLVDRDPWQLELYRLQRGKLKLMAKCAPGGSSSVVSQVLPLEFRLAQATPRPIIEVAATDSERSWTV